jgi:chemotaxis protein CheC
MPREIQIDPRDDPRIQHFDIGVFSMTVTVLIVDDSKLARIVTAKNIHALQPDWDRVEASNADEALSVVAARKVDLALLDYNMPGRNGLELASELRALIPDHATRRHHRQCPGRDCQPDARSQRDLRRQTHHRGRIARLYFRRGFAPSGGWVMTEPFIALSEIEHDALTELVNIGVSRAAVALRLMVREEILLSVPSIDVVSHKTAVALLGEREGDKLVAVRQDFSGAFAGRALLIFPQANSLELVRAVVGDEMSLEDAAAMEKEALAETGNVILNGCLATMANMLHRSLSMSLPEVLHGDGSRLFAFGDHPDEDGLVLFLYINFAMQDRDIRGYIAMLMDLPSLASLRLLIGDFIDRVMNEDIPVAV